MPTPTDTPTPPKPTLPPFWKWLMRVTFAVTMVLFLAPTVYVVKYYAVDKPREEAYARQINACACIPQKSLLAIVYWERQMQGTDTARRMEAARTVGGLLRLPGASLRYPLECLSAKAALANSAVKDADPAVRTAASEELGKVAQGGGAVIRR